MFLPHRLVDEHRMRKRIYESTEEALGARQISPSFSSLLPMPITIITTVMAAVVTAMTVHICKGSRQLPGYQRPGQPGQDGRVKVGEEPSRPTREHPEHWERYPIGP